MRSRRLCLALALVLAAACGGDDDGGTEPDASARRVEGPAPEWPAPPDPLARVEAAGLTAERKEFLETHRHAHLDVFFNGEEVVVPAGIGIDIEDPGVRHSETSDGPTYGGIELCDRPCISPLHTHDQTGTVHTEARTDELRTLGQFFTEWDVRLDDTCVGEYCEPDTDVAVYVDGDLYDGDRAEIELEDGRQIAIVIGVPPDEIPSEFDPSGA